MSWIGRIKSLISRSDGNTVLRADNGGELNRDNLHTQPAGVDSIPLDGDVCVSVDLPHSGGQVLISYQDANNQQSAGQGEIRLYARDANGSQVCELWLKGDGSIDVQTDASLTVNGVLEVDSSKVSITGDVEITGDIEVTGEVDVTGLTTINDAQITNTGDVITAATLPSGAISLSTHTHGGVTPGGGSTSGPQ